MRANRATGRHRGAPLLGALLASLPLLAACGGGSSSSGAAAPDSGVRDVADRAVASPAPAAAGGTGYVDPAPSTGCGRRGEVAPGIRELTLRSGGLDRTYRLHIPSSYRRGRPHPVVLELHGLASPVDLEVLVSGFDAKAVEQGAIHVAPEGGAPGPGWNVAGYEAWPDDVAFVADLLNRLEADLCVDRRREYAIGMSNGAHMVARLACDLSDRLAAFVVVAGLVLPQGCEPVRAVPLLAFLGTADPVLPLEGGIGPVVTEELAALGPEAATGYAGTWGRPVDEVTAGWADLIGCMRDPVVIGVTRHVIRQDHPDCDEGAELTLYLVDGGGHTWPGSEGSAAVGGPSGSTTMEIDANDILWDFLQGHPRPG